MKAHIGIDLQPVRTITKVLKTILHKSFHTVVLKTPQQGRSLNSVTVVMLALQFDTSVTFGKLRSIVESIPSPFARTTTKVHPSHGGAPVNHIRQDCEPLRRFRTNIRQADWLDAVSELDVRV
uniref:(northern house mosquito) hypothetical protein n=1 Tax=Culex pipiens TaxID=7175 RepID=A0A8D8D539_CULPI